jgi:general nucleoside transport system permease protein
MRSPASCAALAGAYMATALQAGFGREMTAGRGYIALAALIFAKWRPVQACMPACCSASSRRWRCGPTWSRRSCRSRSRCRFLDALPYILTVIVLAGFIGKAIPPRAGGEPYVKER